VTEQAPAQAEPLQPPAPKPPSHSSMGGPKMFSEDSALLDKGRSLDKEIEAALRSADAAAEAAAVHMPREPTAPSPGRNLLIFFCISGFIFNQINFSQLPAFLPDYAERTKGVAPTWVGLILGIQGVCGMLATLIAPMLIRRFANMPTLAAAQSILAISTLVLGLCCDGLGEFGFIALCMSMRALQGFADGVAQVSSMSVIVRVVPPQTTGMYVGLTEGLRSIGTLIGPVIGGFAYRASWEDTSGNWRLPFILTGSFVTMNAVAFVLLASSVDHARIAQSPSRKSLYTIYAIPHASLIVFACAASIFTLGFYEPTLVPYLTGAPFKLTTGQTGLLMTGTSLIMGVTAAIAGPAQYVCGQMVQMVVGELMAAGSMALFGFTDPYAYPQFTVVSYVMSCASVMVIFVAATEMLVRVLRTFDVDPNDHAEALSAGVSFSFTAGLVGGSLCGGAMQQHLDFRGACRSIFYILITLPVITIVPFHPLFMRGKKLAKSAPGPKNKKGRRDVEEGED